MSEYGGLAAAFTVEYTSASCIMCAVRPKLESEPVVGHLSAIHDWPHAPLHQLKDAGVFMVTSGTYQKARLFRTPERLTFLTKSLTGLCQKYSLDLQAWALFPNHYHFLAQILQPRNLSRLTRHLHSSTAIWINGQDGAPNRKVWFQYWESHITFHRSYLARLNYVYQNPVKHGIVRVASDYPWCSAEWFERKANRAFFRTVMNFPCDRIDIPDDFEA
jgi:putative transposase